jgi:hypothetical protein
VDTQEKMMRALNKLTKWRAVFAGWQLGTRPKGDPESDALRDHREATMILRAEVTTLVGLLCEKGVFTIEEFQTMLTTEAGELDKIYERIFPGFKATHDGIEMNAAIIEEHGTMKGWRP